MTRRLGERNGDFRPDALHWSVGWSGGTHGYRLVLGRVFLLLKGQFRGALLNSETLFSKNRCSLGPSCSFLSLQASSCSSLWRKKADSNGSVSWCSQPFYPTWLSWGREVSLGGVRPWLCYLPRELSLWALVSPRVHRSGEPPPGWQAVPKETAEHSDSEPWLRSPGMAVNPCSAAWL